MDRHYDIELEKTLQDILDKTGVEVQKGVIKVQKHDSMNRRWWRRGVFDGTYIWLNPSIFCKNDSDDDRCRTILSNLKHAPIESITDEDIAEWRRWKEEDRINTIHEVVAHEVGHYIHACYFGNRGYYFKTAESCRINYSKKNCRENFADAFEEYINERISDTTSRYQKMKSLMDELKVRITVDHLEPFYKLVVS